MKGKKKQVQPSKPISKKVKTPHIKVQRDFSCYSNMAMNTPMTGFIAGSVSYSLQPAAVFKAALD